MKDVRFRYQAETFSKARSALMLPHPQGESDSISSAFHECFLGLRSLDRQLLYDDAGAWVRELEEFMDATGVEDPTDRGAWATKADRFTIDEKIRISRLVDELADWFERAEGD